MWMYQWFAETVFLADGLFGKYTFDMKINVILTPYSEYAMMIKTGDLSGLETGGNN